MKYTIITEKKTLQVEAGTRAEARLKLKRIVEDDPERIFELLGIEVLPLEDPHVINWKEVNLDVFS